MSSIKTLKPQNCMSLKDLSQLVSETEISLDQELQKLFGVRPWKSWVTPQMVRQYLASKGYSYPYKVFSFQMLKGGVAKTTSCLNFGLRAAQYGARVLMIDLDQQANLTFALGAEDEDHPVWVDIVEKKNSIQDCILNVQENLDLVPSSLNNSVLDRLLLSSSRNWVQAVKAPLKEVRSHYDIVIIDTAPNISMTNTAVTAASDVVVLPVNPDRFAMMGLRKHLEDLQEIKKEFSLEFSEKILFTRYDGREAISQDLLRHCIDQYHELMMENYVRTSSDVKNTIASGKSLFQSKSLAKEDYDLVTRELLGFGPQL